MHKFTKLCAFIILSGTLSQQLVFAQREAMPDVYPHVYTPRGRDIPEWSPQYTPGQVL